MKRFKRLNGWQRLWVVISALSLLYTLGDSFMKGSNQYRIEYQVTSAFEKPECKYIVDLPAGFKLDQEPGYDNPCWELYLYRLIYEDARNTKDGYIEHMISLRRTSILQITGIMLVVWLVGIGLLYGAGATVAWVVKGFQSKSAE